ncbi:hypothetical protein FS842_000077 [Serendipita sp. 407]|nr:hypothetical protein FS842_000077 [Serendipita sp. 407]
MWNTRPGGLSLASAVLRYIPQGLVELQLSDRGLTVPLGPDGGLALPAAPSAGNSSLKSDIRDFSRWKKSDLHIFCTVDATEKALKCTVSMGFSRKRSLPTQTISFTFSISGPARGNFQIEIAENRAFTTFLHDRAFVSDGGDGKDSSRRLIGSQSGGRTGTDGFGLANLHACSESAATCIARAIGYCGSQSIPSFFFQSRQSDLRNVSMGNFVIFSVRHQ